MKFKSLKTRILFWFGGVTSIILILFSLIFYFSYENNVYASIEKNLYEEAIFLSDKNIQNFDKNRLAYDIAIVEKDKILFQTDNFNFKLFNTISNTKKRFKIIDNGESLSAFYFYNIDDSKSIVVYQDEIDDKIEDIVDTMILVEPLLLLALMILGSKIIDKILIPIKELTKATNEISINNFSRTIPLINQEDEIKNLVNSFNDMIVRLQDGVNNLDRFNSDVSHELRTPLTVIKGEIDITLRKLREPEYYINSLNTISFETKQIEKIVENLLLLTKYTKENIEKSFELTNIDTILMDTIYSYEGKLKEKEINLEIKNIDSIKFNGNPLLIRTIFSNLIDNAIKYTPNKKSIFMELSKKERVHFIIEDEGIGIEESKLSSITKRFYRVDESRNKKVEGFGLGLSIVENSIELHNGKLLLNSELNKGTKIEVIL